MTHRAKATHADGVTTVKAILEHPMETGLRKDQATGKLVPAHHIEELTVTHNGANVLTGNLGPAVSKNPLIHFTFKGGKAGDTVVISWNDNQGKTDKVETKIE